MPISVSIVEDNDQLRATLGRVLSRADGFRFVSEYANAEDALKGLPQEKSEVVLMDINLRDTDGLKVTEQITKLMLPTTVVMMSVQSEPEYIQRAMMVGDVAAGATIACHSEHS